VAQLAHLDSSALLKLVRLERESEALVDYLSRPTRSVASSLCIVEVVRAVRRAGLPADDVESLLEALDLIEVSPVLLWRTARLDPTPLRTLDAVHVAAALMVNDGELTFVTYDARQAEAARANGLRVVQPGC